MGGSVEGQHYEVYIVRHVMSDEEQEAVWEIIRDDSFVMSSSIPLDLEMYRH